MCRSHLGLACKSALNISWIHLWMNNFLHVVDFRDWNCHINIELFFCFVLFHDTHSERWTLLVPGGDISAQGMKAQVAKGRYIRAFMEEKIMSASKSHNILVTAPIFKIQNLWKEEDLVCPFLGRKPSLVHHWSVCICSFWGKRGQELSKA